MTTIRNADRIRGTVQDLPYAMSLSATDCNVLVCSTRTLYLIQNYGLGEVGYISRYASSFLDGGKFVVANTPPEIDQINDIQNRYQLEVVDMSCDLTLALNGIQAAILTSTSNACACGSVGETVEAGAGISGGDPPEGYGEPDPAVTDRLCKAANVIHQSILAAITELEESPAEEYLDLGFGLVAGLVSAIIAAAFIPVVGILVTGVAGAIVAVTLALIASGVDLTSLLAALIANEVDLVCALYGSAGASDARDRYLQVLDDAGQSVQNQALIYALLPNDVLNILWFSINDTEEFLSTYVPPTSCATCPAPCLSFQPWDDGSGVSGTIEILTPSSFRMHSAPYPGGCHAVGVVINVEEGEGAQCGPMLQVQFDAGATTGYGGCTEWGVRLFEDSNGGWPTIIRTYNSSIIWSSFRDARTIYFVRDDGPFTCDIVTIPL